MPHYALFIPNWVFLELLRLFRAFFGPYKAYLRLFNKKKKHLHSYKKLKSRILGSGKKTIFGNNRDPYHHGGAPAGQVLDEK